MTFDEWVNADTQLEQSHVVIYGSANEETKARFDALLNMLREAYEAGQCHAESEIVFRCAACGGRIQPKDQLWCKCI